MASRPQKKQAMVIYCEERMRKLGSRMSIQQAIAQFNNEWSALSDTQKNVYKQKAKKYNQTFTGRHVLTGKVDTTGQPVEKRKDEDTEVKRRQNAERAARDTWLSRTDLKDVQSFVFIHMLETFRDDNNQYYPVEIGMVRYNMLSGFERSYHCFPRPTLPQGTIGTAQEQAERSHKIMVTSHDYFTDDISYVWREVLNFIQPSGTRTEEFPVIYAREAEVKTVESCLKYLALRAGDHYSPLVGKVYIYEGLLQDIVKTYHQQFSEKNMDISQIREQLYDSTKYDYSPNLKCEFHEAEENRICAMQIAHKMGLVMGDILFALELISFGPNHRPHEPGHGVAQEEKPLYEDVSHHIGSLANVRPPPSSVGLRPKKEPHNMTFNTIQPGMSEARIYDQEHLATRGESGVLNVKKVADNNGEKVDYNDYNLPAAAASSGPATLGYPRPLQAEMIYDSDEDEEDQFPPLSSLQKVLPRPTQPAGGAVGESGRAWQTAPQPAAAPQPPQPRPTPATAAAVLLRGHEDDEDDDDDDDADEEEILNQMRGVGGQNENFFNPRGRGITMKK